MKLSTTLQLFITKELTLDASTMNDKFIISEPEHEEPQMIVLQKPKPINAESTELF